MTTAPRQGDEIGRWGLFLIAVWIAPPLLWLLQLQTSYSFASLACEIPRVLPIVAAIAATAFLVGGLAVVAWRAGRRAREPGPDASPGVARFVATIGLFLTLQLLLILAAQALALAILAPCS